MKRKGFAQDSEQSKAFRLQQNPRYVLRIATAECLVVLRYSSQRRWCGVVRVQAGRNAVLKTPGWKQAVTIAGEDPKIKAVADELIDSLQIKRDILGSAGIARQISDQWLIETDWTDHAEIDTALENLWALEDQRGAKVDGAQEPPLKTVPSRRSDWVEVRVFVSSTFADMHAEREVRLAARCSRARARALGAHAHACPCGCLTKKSRILPTFACPADTRAHRGASFPRADSCPACVSTPSCVG
jgi:hypothetical protein